jgi:hypothetical protein
MIRIVVGTAPGPRSGMWLIFTHGDDIYVQSNGMRKDIKTSLHKSGVGHTAFTESGTARWKPDGDRYMAKWGEPEEFAPGGRTLLGIVLPPTTSQCRTRSRRSTSRKRSRCWPRPRQARR